MLKLIKLTAVTTAVLVAAMYGLYILTDPMLFIFTVVPLLVVFSLVADWFAGYLYAREQKRIAANIDTRIVDRFNKRKLLRND